MNGHRPDDRSRRGYDRLVVAAASRRRRARHPNPDRASVLKDAEQVFHAGGPCRSNLHDGLPTVSVIVIPNRALSLRILVTSDPSQVMSVGSTRDWLDYLGAFSGVIGAVLAAMAIAYAGFQSVAAKRDLIKERQLGFELGLLAELRREMGVTQLRHISGYVGALIRDPAEETDLPVLRAAIGMKQGPEGVCEMNALLARLAPGSPEAQTLVLRRAIDEVDSAISRRLTGG
jgi:hypothetical protein